MMNIGYRPTVSDNSERRIEAHLFDFNGDLYGTKLEVYVLDKVRDEQNFDSLDSLTEQLKKDEVTCKRILDKLSVRS